MRKNYKKTTNALGFMNIIIVHIVRRYVSATHVAIFRVVVHCANHIVAHQAGSQSTTCTLYVPHSTEPYPRQRLLTSNILYLDAFSYHPEDGHMSVRNVSVITM
jgi:hypothetical protein